MSETVATARPWVAPSIDPGEGSGIINAEDVDRVLEEARREGFEAGRKEGLSAGRTEGLRAGEKDSRQRLQRLDQLHAALSTPLDQIDEEVQRRIVALALTLARQVVRVELDTRPECLLPLVREAVEQLAPSREAPTVYLNPQDLALLRDLRARSEEPADWRLLADERVSRGGCRVHSAFMEIDATLETRLQKVAADLQVDTEQVLQS